LVISESGIVNRADIERLSGHCDGFLIGSSAMRGGDPGGVAKSLVFGRIKLCGMRTRDDLRAARNAAFAGLVFVPGTPRAITVQQALEITAGGHHPPLVGVFRDASAAFVREVARQLPLAAVQLHKGDYVEAAPETWVAEAPGDAVRTADRIVFDNGRGGSGERFDWSTIAHRPELPRALLAGGIGAHNALAALATGAYAIDVGSAMDERPGVKSHSKIARLFDVLRPVSRRQALEPCD